MDWMECPEIEIRPGVLGGAPVLRGSRVRPEHLLLNIDQGAEWLAEAHQLSLDQVRAVLRFHERSMGQLAPAV